MTKRNNLVKQLVSRVLTNHPEARSNDVELHICCLEEQGLALSYYQKSAIRRAFSFESVRRQRQLLQANGYFLADPATRRGRKQKADRMRVEMRQKPKPVPVYIDGKVDHYVI
jgi:hypothetical protein